MKKARQAIFGAALAAIAATSAMAQEPPALQGASAEEKARLQRLIEGARREGSLSYIDAIIQPETNDALAAAFKRRYGLPAAFQVNYTLSATLALITRVDQEIGAGRVTIDVAAVGSAP